MATSMQLVAGGSGIAGLNAPDGRGVDVALIDSGVVPVGGLAQPGRVVYGPDFSSERNDRDLRNLDTFGHGTHLAGLIAGRDPITGFAGVAPGARVVQPEDRRRRRRAPTSRGSSAALDWVRRNHDATGYNIRVVNLSLGVVAKRLPLRRAGVGGRAALEGGHRRRRRSRQQRRPRPHARHAGRRPVRDRGGASDTMKTANPFDDRVADFSSRSRWRAADLVAPGTSVVSLRVPGSTLDTEFPSARVDSKFFRGSGTSQAAAITSGLVARLLSAKPWLTPDQVKATLTQSAVDLPDPRSADGVRPRRPAAGRWRCRRRRRRGRSAVRAGGAGPRQAPSRARGQRRPRPRGPVERPPLVRSPLVGPPLVVEQKWTELGRTDARRPCQR